MRKAAQQQQQGKATKRTRRIIAHKGSRLCPEIESTPPILYYSKDIIL